MSEGDKQAPISSGWWYELNLSFCISLLSAAGCRVTHALVAGVKRDFLPPPPPPPPPPRHPEHCHLLSHLFLNLRGSVWSLLLKTAYFVIFFECCVKVLIWMFRWIVEQSLNCCWKNLCTCVFPWFFFSLVWRLHLQLCSHEINP